MGRGRKTKFDAETMENILRLLRNGVPICDACQTVDVHETNFRRRLKRDSQFRSEVTRARARGKAALIAQIAQDRDWRAKAWLLSRLYPSQFAETESRRIPQGEAAEEPRPAVAFILNSKEGKRPITWTEAESRFANFPVVEHDHSQPESEPRPDYENEALKHRFVRGLGVVPIEPIDDNDNGL